MGWIVSAILIICVIILIIKLRKKVQLDTFERNKYEQDVAFLKHQKETLRGDIDFCEKQIHNSQEEYRRLMADQARELDEFYDRGKRKRLEQLENEISIQEKQRQENLDLRMHQLTSAAQEKVNQAEASAREEIAHWEQARKDIEAQTLLQEERYAALLEPLQQYEKSQQERLYYTIQIPEEYHNDIDYLLTTVAQKVQHPDIISKLVWSEYIKPAMDETIRRVGIEDKSGIYKITNIEDGKSYIGKSTNIKKRLQDHFKSSVGITNIADQAIHHAILKQGIWNWMIEPIIYCDKDQLNEMEKYYIEFFKTQEYGYNKTGGG